MEQGKDTVSLPASNGATNFTGAPIDSPAKVIATITPPTVRMTPMPSTNPRALADPVLPYRRRNAIALPEFARPDFSDQDSPFILKTPPPVLKNYASSADRQLAATQLGPAPIQTELEVITVAGGKQFAGHVLQRGVSYRVQLPNGSVLSFPAERVISVNPAQPMVPAAPVVLPAGM